MEYHLLCISLLREQDKYMVPWSRVHKAFQNQDQDQTQVKHSSTMDYFFKTYYNYLTID